MKRWAWVLLVLVISLFILASPVVAQEASPWYTQSLQEYGQSLENVDSVHKEGYDIKTQTDLQNAMTCQISGCSTNPSHTFYYGKSAITTIGNYVAMMYANPPADLALWLKDTAVALGFSPKPAYAQGVGFSGLSALLPIWKAFRNIAYLLLAIVMIVIGFMVMFRKKIDPKTVVTVQNALPKIVITLLLITFSYAIVGIMVDLMYLLILLVVGVFQSTGLLPDPSSFAKTIGYSSNQSLYTQGGLLSNMWNIFGFPTGFGNVGGYTTPMQVGMRALGIDPSWAAGGAAVFAIGGLALTLATGSPWGLLLAAPAGLPPLIGFLISLALLFLTIRLFIFFLSSYIQIILALLFAPLQLVMEAIPGSSAFAGWLKNLTANLIVFPIGAAAFMLSAIFANISNQPLGSLWTPPFTPLVSASLTSVAALISVAILFVIPTIAGQIKESLKAKPALPVGAGLGQALGSPFATGTQLLSLAYYVKALTPQRVRETAGAPKIEKK